VIASPSCARGDWRPLTSPPVRVAAHSSTAVFASAGCVEVWSLQDHAEWSHAASLPASLDLADDEMFVPWAFGTQVSVSDGVMAVSAQVRKGGGKGGVSVPAVAMYVSISRTEWVLAEVIKCDAPACYHVPQPCSAQGAFPSPEDSPTGCMGGGFGSAISVIDQLLAVGIPNNSTVVLYKEQSLGDQEGPAPSGLSSVGVGLVWKYDALLQGPAAGSAKDAFGSSIAMSSSIIVVGNPMSEPAGGALVFSLLTDSADGGAEFGELILDVRQQCCILKLACCQSAFVGRSVAHMQQGSTARLAVGDPSNDGALLLDCDLSAMQHGPGNSRASNFCVVTSHVKDTSSGAEAGGDPDGLGRGMGASVAMGGGLMLFGNPTAGCPTDRTSNGGACGHVCHAASCPPGTCRLYDVAVESHLCLECSDEGSCPGGVEVCFAPPLVCCCCWCAWCLGGWLCNP